MDLRFLLKGLRASVGPRERAFQGQRRLSALVLHASEGPSAHREMIEALESRFKAEECTFRTIFGTLEGHRIYASRKVAKKIEVQTRHQAEFYNVDVRQDLHNLAEKDQVPYKERDESILSHDFEVTLAIHPRIRGALGSQ